MLYKITKGGCKKDGYNPKSHIAAPATPTHNGMRMLLEWDIPPEGTPSCSASVGR